MTDRMIQDSECGGALIEALIVIPLMISLLFVLVFCGVAFSQLMWTSNSSYYTSHEITFLDKSLSIDQRERVAEYKLSTINHFNFSGTWNNAFFQVANLFETSPLKKAAIPVKSGKELETSSITIGGELKRTSFLAGGKLQLSTSGIDLKHGEPLPFDPDFSDSGKGLVSCCGVYGDHDTKCIANNEYSCKSPQLQGYREQE